MINKQTFIRIISFVLILSQLPIPGTAAEKTVRMGIVVDGADERWQPVEAIFLEELAALSEGEFVVQVPPTKHLDGQWSAAKISAALDQLDADKEVDIILALGFASSQQAASRKTYRKPTFAPLVTNTSFSTIPRKDITSGIANLNYLTSEARLGDQLKLYQRVVPFKRLAVLLDDTLYQSIPDIAQLAIQKAGEYGIELSFVSHAGEKDLVAKIPGTIEAVMVGPLPRLDKDSRRRMIEGLISRKLPSFSLRGNDEVEEGMLLSDVSSADIGRCGRQTALNIHAVLRGEKAGDQSVVFERKSQVTLNMATARALGISPRWEIIREAVILNEEANSFGPPLQLPEVAKEVLRVNLDVIAGQLGVRADAREVARVRSVLLPQLEGDLDYTKRKDDFPMVTSGFAAEQTTRASLTLNQLIFSESALANLSIQKKLQLAREAQQRGLELDVIEQASTAYLSILTSRTQYDIQQNRLRFSQENWKLVKDRMGVGKVDVSDVYRWESEIATTRQRVLGAKARLEQSRDRLNALLHRPLEERTPVAPVRLHDPQFFVGRPEFLEIVDSERTFALMTKFFVEEALRLSPDVNQLEKRVLAQERRLLSERLNFLMPTISFNGEGSRVLDERWAPNTTIRLEDENDWRIGLNLDVPIIEGGDWIARTAQANFNLQQLKAQRDAARQRVEQNVRDSLHALRASYPAIELSRQAAEAAQKTYDLVSKNYVRGTRSVVELLDAQDASLAADQTAANAVYSALADLMALQRSLGEFDFFMTDAQLTQKMERMRTYIKEHSR